MLTPVMQQLCVTVWIIIGNGCRTRVSLSGAQKKCVESEGGVVVRESEAHDTRNNA
jgi:hypothetical protein